MQGWQCILINMRIDLSQHFYYHQIQQILWHFDPITQPLNILDSSFRLIFGAHLQNLNADMAGCSRRTEEVKTSIVTVLLSVTENHLACHQRIRLDDSRLAVTETRINSVSQWQLTWEQSIVQNRRVSIFSPFSSADTLNCLALLPLKPVWCKQILWETLAFSFCIEKMNVCK